MDIEYVNQVIFPPRDDKGQPKFLAELSKAAPLPKDGITKDENYQIRRMLWAIGWPDYRIEEYVAQMVAARDELLRQAGVRRR